MTRHNRICIAMLSLVLTFMQVIGYYISAKYNTTVHSVLIRIVDSDSPKWIYALWALLEMVIFYFLFFRWFSYLETEKENVCKEKKGIPKKLEQILSSGNV